MHVKKTQDSSENWREVGDQVTVYRLNEDWVEVETGDFMWLRAHCPQASYAGGPGRFRYLLYKDVDRHPDL